MARRHRKTQPRLSHREVQAEKAWKWLLRLVSLGAAIYIIFALRGDVPLGTYVFIGGMGAFPHVYDLQKMLDRGEDDEDDEDDEG